MKRIAFLFFIILVFVGGAGAQTQTSSANEVPSTAAATFGGYKWRFRQFSTSEDPSSGLLDYGSDDANALTIFGKGNSVGTRLVKIKDNLTIVGKLSSYNGLSTQGNGTPVEVINLPLTGQTAAIASTTLYAVPSAGAGLYRIGAYVVTSTAGTAGTIGVSFGWNDGVQAQSSAALNVNANTLGSVNSATILVRANNSTNITYTVTFTGVTGTPQYTLYLTVETL